MVVPLAPLRGLFEFLIRPSQWRAVISASPMAVLVLLAVAIATLVWYWPAQDGQVVWPDVAQYLLVLAGAFLILVPFARGRLGAAVVSRHLQRHDRQSDPDARRTIGARISYFLWTLPWRLIWALAAYGGWSIHPYLGLAVGMWGIGHLTMLDAADQALLVGGLDRSERMHWARTHQRQIIGAGFTAGILFVFAGITVFGWFLWLPGCFLGAADIAMDDLPQAADTDAAGAQGESDPEEAIAPSR